MDLISTNNKSTIIQISNKKMNTKKKKKVHT